MIIRMPMMVLDNVLESKLSWREKNQEEGVGDELFDMEVNLLPRHGRKQILRVTKNKNMMIHGSGLVVDMKSFLIETMAELGCSFNQGEWSLRSCIVLRMGLMVLPADKALH